jgi:hypothetical protein
MAEKIDLEASKNEDFNTPKLSDLSNMLKKIHLGDSEKRIAVSTMIGLLMCMSTPAIAQTFRQDNGVVVEVLTKGPALASPPGPFTCTPKVDVPIRLTVDRDGNVKGAMLFMSSNYPPPACTDEAIAHASTLRFAPSPTARRREEVYVTYRAPKTGTGAR